MNHRDRWGVSVIERYRQDGSIERMVYERPSVRSESGVSQAGTPLTRREYVQVAVGAVVVCAVGYVGLVLFLTVAA